MRMCTTGGVKLDPRPPLALGNTPAVVSPVALGWVHVRPAGAKKGEWRPWQTAANARRGTYSRGCPIEEAMSQRRSESLLWKG